METEKLKNRFIVYSYLKDVDTIQKVASFTNREDAIVFSKLSHLEEHGIEGIEYYPEGHIISHKYQYITSVTHLEPADEILFPYYAIERIIDEV